MLVKRQLYFACLFLCLFVFIFTGCDVVDDAMGGTHSRNHDSISSPKSFVKTYGIKVKNNNSMLRIKMDLKLKEGQISWSLKDPNGKIRWRDALVGKGGYKETKYFEPIQGTWTLDFSCDEGAGDFVIEWKAN